MDCKQNRHITLITTNAIGFPFFMFHRAIKFRGQNGSPMVIHNTTGGVEIINYDAFMKGRRVYQSKRYSIRDQFDPYEIIKFEKRDFDWMNYNCEDFTTKIINNYTNGHLCFSSPQRNFWMTLAFILLIILIIKKS